MSAVVISGVDSSDLKTLKNALKGREEAIERDLSEAQAVGDVAQLQPLLVVLGPEMNGADRFNVTRKLIEADPTIGVLIIDTLNEKNMVKALEAGARAVLAPASSPSDTRKAVERVIEGSKRLRERSVVADPGSLRRTIAVISAKGGAGKTMVSVNLATMLALAERRGTVLVDLDLQFGDVAAALLLDPDHTVIDAAASITAGRPTALKVFLTRHGPSDLFALCASDDPASGEQIGAAAVTAITDELREEFRYVVADTSAGLDEPTLAILEEATDIVIVVDLDVASVRGGRKLIETLNLIGMRDARRLIVLNRSNSKVGLRVDEVEVVLGAPIDVMLPSSRAVPLSFNRGEPLAMARPRHAYSKGIAELAGRFVTQPRRRRA